MGWLPVAVTAVAFLLRALTAGGDAVTTDEPVWITRSDRFREAVATGDFAAASASSSHATTMPGVSTMWVGAAAGWAWEAGQGWGWWAEEDDGFPSSPAGMDIAQVAMAAVVAVMAGVLTALLVRWVGGTAAAVAGLLIATEPFLVAHGAVLHTDELAALAGTAALVALALALGVAERTPWTGRRRAAAAAGALFAVALLTKVSAVTFLPGGAGLVAWALVRARRGTEGRAPLAQSARMAAWAAAATAVVVVAAYPALWVAPGAELAAVWRSSTLAGEEHVTFFLGEAVPTPGPLYYAVALPLRVTPWFLVGGLVAAVAVWRGRTRGTGLALAAMGLPTLVAVSVAAKQFDRYGIPVLVVGAVLVGVVAGPAAREAARRWDAGRRLGPAAAALVAGGVVVHALAVVPWGLAYFNPLLGGASAGTASVLVGWREGLEQAGPIIAEHAAGRCDEVIVDAPGSARLYPCGRLRPGEPAADYVVAYVSVRQRDPEALARRVAGRPRLGTVVERGILYAEVYGPRRSTRPPHL